MFALTFGNILAKVTLSLVMDIEKVGQLILVDETHAKSRSFSFFSATLVLTLPPSLEVSDIRWISVWCRRWDMSFGDLVLKPEEELELELQLQQQEEESGKNSKKWS